MYVTAHLIHGTPHGYFLEAYHSCDSLQAFKLIRAHRRPTRTNSLLFINAQRGLGSAHDWLGLNVSQKGFYRNFIDEMNSSEQW